MSPFLRLAALLVLAGAVVAAPAASDCTGTISSLDDVDDAVKCTTVVINSFTVPAGETLNLDLATGTTVNMGVSLAPALFCACSPARWLQNGCTSNYSEEKAHAHDVSLVCRGRRDLRRQELGRTSLPSQVGSPRRPTSWAWNADRVHSGKSITCAFSQTTIRARVVTYSNGERVQSTGMDTPSTAMALPTG